MFSDSLFTPRRAKTSGAAAYRSAAVEIQVAGADAHRLVTLLFEGFESAIADAHGGLVGGDTERKCRSLTRAIRIIDEGLRAHLNLKEGGELARDLAELYGYVVNRLALANVRNDPALLTECARLIKPLHEAWISIGHQSGTAR